MKRLAIAPATEEDEAIWWRVTRGTFPFNPVMCAALVNPDSDRRDAELMLQWVGLRGTSFVGPSPITWDGVPVSGRVIR
jgi:hypothetical protein